MFWMSNFYILNPCLTTRVLWSQICTIHQMEILNSRATVRHLLDLDIIWMFFDTSTSSLQYWSHRINRKPQLWTTKAPFVS